MNAYLIDPSEQTIKQVVIESWRDISPAIGCDLFTCVRINEQDDTVYVDDEGLLNNALGRVGGFRIDGYPDPLAGRGLVLGTDEEGDSTEPHISLWDLKSKVAFLQVLA